MAMRTAPFGLQISSHEAGRPGSIHAYTMIGVGVT